MQNGSSSGRRTSLTLKYKMRNNPKLFLDDEVQSLSGQGIKECNSKLLMNYTQGNEIEQWSLRPKRIPRVASPAFRGNPRYLGGEREVLVEKTERTFAERVLSHTPSTEEPSWMEQPSV